MASRSRKKKKVNHGEASQILAVINQALILIRVLIELLEELLE